jgi:hypothetical protein
MCINLVMVVLAFLVPLTIGCQSTTTGGYSLEATGALTARVEGNVTAEYSHPLSGGSRGYYIEMHFRNASPDFAKYEGGTLVFFRDSLPAPGTYTIVPDLSVTPEMTRRHAVQALLSSSSIEFVWKPVEGQLRIARSGFSGLTGSFTMRMKCLEGCPGDTATVTGRFDTH